MNAAVVDAGPLIHLCEAEALHLLRGFAPLHAPEAVWIETVGRGRVLQGDLDAIGVRRELVPPATPALSDLESAGQLHAGERECLCLCQQLGINVLLTDDLAAREAARRLSLIPVGSVGVIVRACRLRITSRTEADAFLKRLQDRSSLFVTPAIIDLAIAGLSREP